MGKAFGRATTGGGVSVVRDGKVIQTGVCVDEPNVSASRVGYFRLWVERDGRVTQDTGLMENGYQNAGIAATAKKMCGSVAVSDFDYLAIGTDATAFNATDTTLGAEISTNGGGKQQDGTTTTTTTTVTDDTMVVNTSWTITGPLTVQEIACFNAAGVDTGDMIGRSVVAPSVGVADGDTLNGEYTVKWS